MRNHLRFMAGALVVTTLLSSCASSTMLQSTPPGARVYLNGEPVGVTPYQHRDTKIVGSTTDVRLEKEGYETVNTSFSRDEEADAGAIIGGIFLFFPFLWTMKYKPAHSYEMRPLSSLPVAEQSTAPATYNASLPEQLRQLKKLADDKIITQAEYEQQKKKLLGE
ncbi:PEGA domain-containing protein [Hymenobacter profundi]|uniref:PEGA domain-containing protein n=1 Tax=Hymenobacter profundi TaxID=1982110 RepID=A0ABS6X2G0_9BACT|nr:PEGA domain-containing protein [Hymenobacter profundi]MBW3129179.1 PEGA domain-containing protein [Hymenobacter profundi]